MENRLLGRSENFSLNAGMKELVWRHVFKEDDDDDDLVYRPFKLASSMSCTMRSLF